MKNSINIMTCDKAGEVIKKIQNVFFKDIKQAQKNRQKVLICNLIILTYCITDIDSPDLIKNKIATVNPKNNDDKCF